MKKLNVEEIKKELVNEEMSFTELDNFMMENGYYSVFDDGVPAEAIELETPEEQSGEVNLNWNVVGENNIALYEIVRDGVVIERIQDGYIVSYKDSDLKNKTKYKY